MKYKIILAASVAVAAIAGQAAAAEDPAPTTVSPVEVTAPRAPEPTDRVPAEISIVSGADLRARDAHDMASALALVPGVEAPAGGDAGPSSAVLRLISGACTSSTPSCWWSDEDTPLGRALASIR